MRKLIKKLFASLRSAEMKFSVGTIQDSLSFKTQLKFEN